MRTSVRTRMTFNSLSRDHRGEMVIPRDVAEEITFNSLSRDHSSFSAKAMDDALLHFFQLPLSGSLEAGFSAAASAHKEPFNSLSRDHPPPRRLGRVPPYTRLSTPSLGITMSWSSVIIFSSSSLSTPSLGITRGYKDL